MDLFWYFWWNDKWSLRGWWWADVETGMGAYSVKNFSLIRPHHSVSECSPLRHCWERLYPSRPLLSHNWVHLSWTLIRLSHFLPRYHQQLNVNWFSFSEQYLSIVTCDSQLPSSCHFLLNNGFFFAKVDIIFLTNWEVVHHDIRLYRPCNFEP